MIELMLLSSEKSETDPPGLNTWVTLESGLVPATKNNAMFAFESSIYMLTGDLVPAQTNSQLWRYNILDESWTQLTCPLESRSLRTVSVVNGKAYFFGGFPNFGQTWVYDIATDSWARTIDYPVPFYAGTSIAKGTNIYIFGGYNSATGQWLNRATRFDTVAKTMTVLAVMPAGLSGGVATSFNNQYIDYMLGSDNNGNSIQGYRYNITANSWGALPTPVVDVAGWATCAQTDKLGFIFFGSNGNTKVDALRQYNGTLFKALPKPVPRPGARSRTAMARIGHSLYVFGGEGPTATLRDFWRYDI